MVTKNDEMGERITLDSKLLLTRQGHVWADVVGSIKEAIKNEKNVPEITVLKITNTDGSSEIDSYFEGKYLIVNGVNRGKAYSESELPIEARVLGNYSAKALKNNHETGLLRAIRDVQEISGIGILNLKKQAGFYGSGN